MAGILVVDDDGTIRELLRYVLVDAGNEVYEVQNGDEGWRVLAAFRFPLAVIDITTPGCGGIEVVRIVRDSGDVMPILVIASDGGRAPDPLAQAIFLGANRALPKPLQP